jgi:molybdate transport system substrate-binding protein
MKRGGTGISMAVLMTLWWSPLRADGEEITVGAASSLKAALEELTPAFERDSGIKVRRNFGASGALCQQIERGAPIDVFIAAAAQEIARLRSQQLLVVGSTKIVTRNSLVLVVLKGQDGIRTMDDLKNPTIKKIAMGQAKTVPAGRYTAEALEKLGIAKTLSAKMIEAQDVRQVLAYVTSGNVDAGFVYATDALSSDQVAVAAKVDATLHGPIVYQSAVIKATRHQAAAQRFSAFLESQPARGVFRKHGFLTEPDLF